MSINNASPVGLAVIGLYDALDGTNAPQGAAYILKDIIPDRSTQSVWTPRPAATLVTNFPTFTTPGNITAVVAIGTRIYGMITSGLNSGKDQPFCYDFSTTSFVTISGITSANTPNTVVAPVYPTQMVQVSTKILVTHPGFVGSNGYFGWIDVSNPVAPAWTSGNTGGNALTGVPTNVAQFYNRAYYVVGNLLFYSDVLNPTNITNASQSLTIGDGNPIYAISNQSFDTTIGGQSQTLMVFKATLIYQITGDAALSNLLLTPLKGAVGTISPNGVANTPMGTFFIAVDGVRYVDQNGDISLPLAGVQIPFIKNLFPNQISADYNNNVCRISVTNSGGTFSEYWYHLDLQQWTGPHSFPSQTACAYQDTFILAVNGLVGLWRSDVVHTASSTFVENGNQLSWTLQTAPYADTTMTMKNIGESTVDMGFTGTSGNINCAILNSQGSTLNNCVVGSSAVRTIWGSFLWGNANWSALVTGFKRYSMYWSQPVTTEKFAIQLTGTSFYGFKVSDIWIAVELLGYVNEGVG